MARRTLDGELGMMGLGTGYECGMTEDSIREVRGGSPGPGVRKTEKAAIKSRPSAFRESYPIYGTVPRAAAAGVLVVNENHPPDGFVAGDHR